MSLIEGLETVVRENEPLAPYTRLRLGGVAEFFAEPTTVEQLGQLVKRFHEAGRPIRLLGGGSNLLVRDEGAEGLVIHLGAPVFCQIQIDGSQMQAGGGTKLSHFVSVAVGHGFAGPENLVGIPGTIGGALHGNAGNHQADIGSWVKSATVMTRKGEILSRSDADMTFAYRSSSLTELVIIDATFEFESESPEQLTRRMQKLWIVKRANQPGIDENAAYIFKDQGGELAGRLIEQAGLRGTKIGAVEISSRDANSFVAGPGATSNDVIRLMELVQARVADRLGITLQPSLVIW